MHLKKPSMPASVQQEADKLKDGNEKDQTH